MPYSSSASTSFAPFYSVKVRKAMNLREPIEHSPARAKKSKCCCEMPGLHGKLKLHAASTVDGRLIWFVSLLLAMPLPLPVKNVS
eukprot:2364164-Pleurochrysis_carterae.AAC.1